MLKKIGLCVASVLLLVAVSLSVQGAALTAERNTPSMKGAEATFGVYTNTIIYAGAMVAINSAGYAVPAADTALYRVVGRAEKTVDNRTNASGAGDSGTKTIKVTRGVFGWDGKNIADTNIGDIVYVFDDQSVSNGGGTASIIAGVLYDYDGTYAWVDTYNLDRKAGAFSTLAISGAATFSTNVTVSGVLAANDGITVDTSKFKVTDANGNTYIDGTAYIKGVAGFSNNITAAGDGIIAGTLAVTGAVTCSTTLTVNGVATLTDGIACDSDKFTVADASGNTYIDGTLYMKGAAVLSNTVTCSTTLTVNGKANLNDGIAVDSTAFTVADVSGNTSVGGTFGSTGVATFSTNVLIYGQVVVTNCAVTISLPTTSATFGSGYLWNSNNVVIIQP